MLTAKVKNRLIHALASTYLLSLKIAIGQMDFEYFFISGQADSMIVERTGGRA